MRAKEYLKQLRKIDKLIENKLIEKEQWKSKALRITSSFGGEKVQTNSNKQKMSSAIDKCVDLEKEINIYIDELSEIKKDILTVIEQLPPDEYDLMHKIYVQFKDLTTVTIESDKSYSWVTTTHGRALIKVQNILDKRNNANER